MQNYISCKDGYVLANEKGEEANFQTIITVYFHFKMYMFAHV